METKNIGNISVYKTKDGSGWMAQITIGSYESGKSKYKRFRGEKKSQVTEAAKNYCLNNIGIINSADIYLEDFLLFFEEKIKKKKLKPASFDRELRTAELHINPYIGHYYLSQLTSDIIQNELIDKLIEKNFSYSSIHKVYILLNSALNYARKNNKIVSNPCENVIQPAAKTIPSKPIRFLSEEEVEVFKKQALSNYKNGKIKYKYGFAILLVLYTGLRGGELCAIKWKDVDFKKRVINVCKNIIATYEDVKKESNFDISNTSTKKKKRVIKEQNSTKTESGNRYIPLNKSAIELLYKLSKINGGNSDDYIITGTRTPVSVDVISSAYTAIAKSAKIERPLGIHTLRHTFASLLIKKGVDIRIVSEILGHANITITYNLYIHLVKEQKAKAIDLLDF